MTLVAISSSEHRETVLALGFGWRATLTVFAACGLFACATGSDSPERSASVSAAETHVGGARVCSWNVRRLGHKFDGKVKDIAKTSGIINDNCDVIAIQEVMQTAGNHTPGYDALLTSLGESWGGVLTERPRPDSTSPNSERYAFFYRKSSASICQGWTAGAEFLKDDEDIFLREPAWTCLKVNAHARELVLVGYHALYGSIAERKREVGWIDDDLDNDGKIDDVVRTIRGTRPGADVVIMGDFNLKPNELHAVLPTYKDLTTGVGSTINNTDAITDNLYDHVLLAPDEAIAAEISPAEVLDVRSVATSAGQSYFQTISDHLPIRFTLGHVTPAVPTPVVTAPVTPPPAPEAPAPLSP